MAIPAAHTRGAKCYGGRGTGINQRDHAHGIPRAYDAHSIGFGQAEVAAPATGVSKLILGIGGSASTDGGAGMLSELGYQILDANDHPIPPGNRGIADSSRIDIINARPLPNQGVKILTDVTIPLTGPNGATAVFRPQKDAAPEDLERLDTALTRFASLFDVDPHTGSGSRSWQGSRRAPRTSRPRSGARCSHRRCRGCGY